MEWKSAESQENWKSAKAKWEKIIEDIDILMNFIKFPCGYCHEFYSAKSLIPNESWSCNQCPLIQVVIPFQIGYPTDMPLCNNFKKSDSVFRLILQEIDVVKQRAKRMLQKILDTQSAFQVEKKEVFYEIGQKVMCGGDEYLLAQVGMGIVALIHTRIGNRKSDPQPVNDVYHITEDEFYKISWGDNKDVK